MQLCDMIKTMINPHQLSQTDRDQRMENRQIVDLISLSEVVIMFSHTGNSEVKEPYVDMGEL